MTAEMPRIADIMTTKLLYFDDLLEESCYEFCRKRYIDCLPDVDGSNHYFLRDDEEQTFVRKEIETERKLDAVTPIFQPRLLARFKDHQLQFVYESGMLIGVVHFSDYNRDVVSTYLYALLAKYERTLRDLAVECGLGNDDMETYLKNNNPGRLGEWRKFKDDMVGLTPLQKTYFWDLMGFVQERGLIDQLHIEAVNKLRRGIMHANEMVGRLPDDVGEVETEFLFDIAWFEEFFERVSFLFRDMRRVANRLALLRGDVG